MNKVNKRKPCLRAFPGERQGQSDDSISNKVYNSLTNKLRCGRITYSNGFPLYGGFLSGAISAEVKWTSGSPNELNQMLEKGLLDLSLISSYHFLTHQETLTLLPGICIAARDKVQSVLLYTKKGLGSIEGQKVALTKESATSVQLLKILCERFWGLKPQYVPLESIECATSYPAFLLIGDSALKHPRFPGYDTTDLASAWHEKTALPLPFALFAASKQVMKERAPEVLTLMQQIKASYNWGRRNEGVILDMAEKNSKLSRKQLESYYSLIHYEMGVEELCGLKAFAALSDLPCHALI